MHKLRKHDHVIYGAGAGHFKKDELAYLSTNLNSAPSPTAGKFVVWKKTNQ